MKLSKRTVILLAPVILLLSALMIWGFLIVTNMNDEGYTVFVFEGESETWSIQLEIVEHNETENNPTDKITMKLQDDSMERPEIVLMIHEAIVVPVQLEPENSTVREYTQLLQPLIQRDHVGFPQPIELLLEWNGNEEEMTLEFVSTVVRTK